MFLPDAFACWTYSGSLSPLFSFSRQSHPWILTRLGAHRRRRVIGCVLETASECYNSPTVLSS